MGCSSRGPTSAPCYRIRPRTPRCRRATSRCTAPVLRASAKLLAQPARCCQPRSSRRRRPTRWRRGSWRRATTTARRCRRWAGSPPGSRCSGSAPAPAASGTARRKGSHRPRGSLGAARIRPPPAMRRTLRVFRRTSGTSGSRLSSAGAFVGVSHLRRVSARLVVPSPSAPG